MKTCPHCHNENPVDFSYCRYCGNALNGVPENKPKSIWKRLPAWVWIILIVGGIAALILTLIGSFIAIATMEGVASIVILICGIVGFGVIPLRRPDRAGSFARAIGLSFFALMGATVDQTGNFLYNKPIEMCFCHDGTSLTRDIDVTNPIPGQTNITQDYTCYDSTGKAAKTINIFAVLGIRFVEYVILGYLLIALRQVRWRIKNNR
ncbi:MAG TPA: zinc ribbon domain-containing protein [Chitinophagales bacterium]|nr:zinc ribbon domain-containing protein [Chitinophagales bacterium]HMU70580.1 zinc ribbon domain-containing protein [Chitinophagales bacterium]HMZ88899.1 zinc ribbon domain-containing protein [Chitinophagales bacterium]HNA56785.1 zinc ribbon domain-containing protein [Chitinophagales bacterium]HNE46795.1 zinc ribbon domain-containing protein [Chitinophagales bacterium]